MLHPPYIFIHCSLPEWLLRLSAGEETYYSSLAIGDIQDSFNMGELELTAEAYFITGILEEEKKEISSEKRKENLKERGRLGFSWQQSILKKTSLTNRWHFWMQSKSKSILWY